MTGVTGEAHAACDMLPAMTDSEYRELVDDIAEHGLRPPPIIVDDDGVILDGRHRLKACQEAGVPPRYDTFAGTETEKVSPIVSENIHRRHLSTAQRAEIAAKLATMKRIDTLKRGPEAPNDATGKITDSQAARLMGVSERSVERAKARLREDAEAHQRATASRLRDEDGIYRPQQTASRHPSPPRPALPAYAELRDIRGAYVRALTGYRYERRIDEIRTLMHTLGMGTWTRLYMPAPAPDMKTWPDGDFIRQLLGWCQGRVDDGVVSPSACEILGHQLNEWARERKRGWSPEPKALPPPAGNDLERQP